MCVCTANWVKACMLFQGMIMISLNPNWFPYQKTGTEIAYSGKLVSDILQAINTIPEIQTFKFTECFHFSILWHLLLCLSYECVHEVWMCPWGFSHRLWHYQSCALYSRVPCVWICAPSIQQCLTVVVWKLQYVIHNQNMTVSGTSSEALILLQPNLNCCGQGSKCSKGSKCQWMLIWIASEPHNLL